MKTKPAYVVIDTDAKGVPRVARVRAREPLLKPDEVAVLVEIEVPDESVVGVTYQTILGTPIGAVDDA